MSELNEQFLVTMTYKTSKSKKLFDMKPVWQVIDTHQNCKVVAGDFATAEEARKKRDELKRHQELHSVAQKEAIG